MTAGDTARGNYNAARTELVERVRLRDHVLLAYLTIVGTILAISFGQHRKSEILLAVPFVAMGASILVSQHNNVIGALLLYLSKDLKPFLISKSEYAPQFGCSKSFRKHSKRSNRYRSIGHAVVIFFPALFALICNIKYATRLSFALTSAWYFGLLCVIIEALIISRAHAWRREVYNDTFWDDQ